MCYFAVRILLLVGSKSALLFWGGVLGKTHEGSEVVFSCDGVYYIAPVSERRICVSRCIYIGVHREV